MKTLLPACLLLVAAAGVFAQPQHAPPPAGDRAGPPPGGEHRGPPPEALAACKSAKAGADCSFTHEQRTVKGSCWAPEGRPLARSEERRVGKEC